MVLIEFTVTDNVPLPPSAFDRGVVTVAGNRATLTSAEDMMVYPDATQLVRGIDELRTRKQQNFEFTGTGTSFTLMFTRRKDLIEIRHGRTLLDVSPVDDVWKAALLAATKMLRQARRDLLPSDGIRRELEDVVSRFMS